MVHLPEVWVTGLNAPLIFKKKYSSSLYPYAILFGLFLDIPDKILQVIVTVCLL